LLMYYKKIAVIEVQVNNFTKGRHAGQPLHDTRRGEPVCLPFLMKLFI